MDLLLQSIQKTVIEKDLWQLHFHTSGGVIEGRFHAAPFLNPAGAVLLVSGSSGGLDGPASRIYRAFCEVLPLMRVACLRIDYRFPSQLESCVKDASVAIEFLERERYRKIVVVGHSFGGAVVISAAAKSPSVTGVITLATQTFGSEPADQISPRPLFLIHGTADKVLSDDCSREVFERAKQPKELKLYLDAGHDLEEVRDRLLRDLTQWIARHCGSSRTAGSG